MKRWRKYSDFFRYYVIHLLPLDFINWALAIDTAIAIAKLHRSLSFSYIQ